MTSVSTGSSSACASALLQVRGLTVTYSDVDSDSVPALRDVNFDMAAGERVGILGESGCGKSTLALSILGLLPPNARVGGSIVFRSESLSETDESRRRAIRGKQISMIFQEPGVSLSPVMRVGDQIAEVTRAHGIAKLELRREACREILKRVHLSDVERVYRAYPHQLSGGERHRIAIAQALVCDPDLVIADEVTRSLDATTQTEVLDVLRAVNQQALIFITHNPALLAGFADRVLVMYAGRIIEDGPVSQVFRRPLHPYTKALLQLVPKSLQSAALTTQGRLPTIPGSLNVSDQRVPGCVFEPRCAAQTSICQTEFPPEITPEPSHRVSCFNYGN